MSLRIVESAWKVVYRFREGDILKSRNQNTKCGNKIHLVRAKMRLQLEERKQQPISNPRRSGLSRDAITTSTRYTLHATLAKRKKTLVGE